LPESKCAISRRARSGRGSRECRLLRRSIWRREPAWSVRVVSPRVMILRRAAESVAHDVKINGSRDGLETEFTTGRGGLRGVRLSRHRLVKYVAARPSRVTSPVGSEVARTASTSVASRSGGTTRRRPWRSRRGSPPEGSTSSGSRSSACAGRRASCRSARSRSSSNAECCRRGYRRTFEYLNGDTASRWLGKNRCKWLSS
jgi:hypothetical protein